MCVYSAAVAATQDVVGYDWVPAELLQLVSMRDEGSLRFGGQEAQETSSAEEGPVVALRVMKKLC